MTVDEPSEFGLRVSPTTCPGTMTEGEWETTTDLMRMLGLPPVSSNERKLRLFGVACCRQLDRCLINARVRKALDAAERYADGKITDDTLSNWSREVDRAGETGPGPRPPERRGELTAYHAVSWVTTPNRYAGWKRVAWEILRLRQNFGTEVPDDLPGRFLDLLRDVFGNPFRPVAFDPAWRTSTAIALARQMYEEREFSAMPILADALQDAGCENADVLGHCRGPGPHVRGCWVVDLVLGKA